MNGTVNQVVLTEVAATSKQRYKTESAESGEFGEMLSGAMQATEKTVKAEDAQANEAALETQQSETEEQNLTGEEDVQEYGAQLAAVMTQTIIPTITEIPQTETSAEEPIQEIPAGTATAAASRITEAAEEAQPQADANTVLQEHDGPAQTHQEKFTTNSTGREATVVAEAEAEAEAQKTAVTEGRLNPQAAEKTADMTVTQKQTQNDTTALSKEETTVITDTADSAIETADRTHQAVRAHNMRHPQQTEDAQSRFDSMLTKASQELNPTAAGEPEAEIETADEPVSEKTFILEEEPQEPDGQEITLKARPEAETKPQENPKSAAQAAVQKEVKAPVREQRPQRELSEPDETLLGMAQQKQPEALRETVRSEPAQQPQQPQAVEQAEQVKTQVIKNLETQKTEFQMQLHPEELGKVNVKMILEGGKLTVEIMTANPRSAEMLSRQADALALSLKSDNIETATVNVVTASENASSQMNGQFDLNNFQNHFRNQDHPSRNGKTGGAQNTREQGGEVGQINFEKPQAPHRLLNYSV